MVSYHQSWPLLVTKLFRYTFSDGLLLKNSSHIKTQLTPSWLLLSIPASGIVYTISIHPDQGKVLSCFREIEHKTVVTHCDVTPIPHQVRAGLVWHLFDLVVINLLSECAEHYWQEKYWTHSKYLGNWMLHFFTFPVLMILILKYVKYQWKIGHRLPGLTKKYPATNDKVLQEGKQVKFFWLNESVLFLTL